MGKPIVIHTMGKVGSSSITKSLEAHGEFEPFQTHQLNPKTIGNFERFHKENDHKMPKHLATSRRVLDEIIPNSDRVRIITLVREPVARNLSSFFQTLYMHKMDNKANARDPQEFISKFFDDYDHDVPLRWFDRQVKEPLGINAYEHAFLFSYGYQTILHDKFEMLLLRCESSDERKLAIIQDFLGCENLSLVSENVSSKKKDYGKAYRETQKQIAFPESYLDRMYESDMARHFYTDLERKMFREKWIRNGANQCNDSSDGLAAGSIISRISSALKPEIRKK